MIYSILVGQTRERVHNNKLKNAAGYQLVYGCCVPHPHCWWRGKLFKSIIEVSVVIDACGPGDPCGKQPSAPASPTRKHTNGGHTYACQQSDASLHTGQPVSPLLAAFFLSFFPFLCLVLLVNSHQQLLIAPSSSLKPYHHHSLSLSLPHYSGRLVLSPHSSSQFIPWRASFLYITHHPPRP